MDYGEVLTRAWKIIWKYKVLWIFGILAGFGGSSRGGSGSSAANGIENRFQNRGGEIPYQWQQFFLQVQRFLENVPIWVWILLVILMIILVLLVITLGTIGRIGLIRGASLGDEDAPRLSFGSLFREGQRYFWRVILLNLLVWIASAIFLAIIFIPGVLLSILTLGVGLLCLIPLICLMVPFFWAVGVVIEQAMIAIVLEDLDIGAGLARGWEVFKRNLGTMIVMALILSIGGAVASFILAVPVLLALVPLFISFFTFSSQGLLGLPLLSVVLFLVYLPFLIILNGIVQSYIGTAWTLTFRRLTGRRPGMPAPVDRFPPPSPVQEFPAVPPAEPLNL